MPRIKDARPLRETKQELPEFHFWSNLDRLPTVWSDDLED